MKDRLDEKLAEALTERCWSGKYEMYAECLSSVRRLRQVNDPTVSVVVIAWKYNPLILENLKILERQKRFGLELIFVDNGAGEEAFSGILPLVDVLVSLNRNTGAYLARNLGAVFARAPLLLFLDDDALPEEDFIPQCLRAFDKYDIVSLRGAIFPRTHNPLNFIPLHYYFGNEPLAAFPELEGVSAYKSDIFFHVGGWDDGIIFGGGGLELSYKIANAQPDLRKQIYYPGMVAYHDYIDSIEGLTKKLRKQSNSKERLSNIHPDIDNFHRHYTKFTDHPELVIRKHGFNDADSASMPVRRRPFNDDLYQLLSARYMKHKYGMYESALREVLVRRKINEPMISVIIAAKNAGLTLVRTVKRLRSEKQVRAEIIIVQNGPDESRNNELAGLADIFVHLGCESTVAMARNIGSLFAQGPILLFLGERALAAPDILKAHLEAYILYEPYAVRGACVPLNEDNPFNKEAAHFHPADTVRPYYGDLTGNLSYQAVYFFANSGFFDTLPACEGIELSSRINLICEDDFNRQIYSPAPVIQMDYVEIGQDLERLKKNEADAWKIIEHIKPYCLGYLKAYKAAEQAGMFKRIRPVRPGRSSPIHAGAPRAHAANP